MYSIVTILATQMAIWGKTTIFRHTHFRSLPDMAARRMCYGPIIFEKMTSSYRQSDNHQDGSTSCLSKTQLEQPRKVFGQLVDHRMLLI